MSYLLRLLGRGLAGDFTGYLSKFIQSPSDTSLEAIQAQVDAHPRRPALLLALGLKQMELGRLGAAGQAMERAVRLDPDMEDACVGLAAVKSDLGDPAGAIEVLDRIVDRAARPVTVHYVIGQLHERRGDQASAASAYRSALAADPAHVSARQRLAALEVVEGNLDAAAQHYATLKRQEPEDFETRMNLAALHARRGDTAGAVREYQDAIIIEPDNWEARCRLADCLEDDGLPEQALAEIRRVLDAHPDYPDMHFRAARVLAAAGDLDAADYHLEQALALNPRYLDALVLGGQMMVERGQMEAGVRLYQRAMRINDTYLEAYVGLAVAYRQMGRQREADEVVEMACEIAPGSGALYREVSRVMMRSAMSSALGRELDLPAARLQPVVEELEPEEVLEAELLDHAEAVKAHPDFPDYRYRYGLLLKSAGRLQEAVEQFRAAVAINPTYVKALVKLGLTAWEMGRLDEAADALGRAVHVEPAYVDLHYRLGLVYADRGLWPMAVDQYRHALARKPDEEAVEASLALALENMGLLSEDGSALAADATSRER